MIDVIVRIEKTQFLIKELSFSCISSQNTQDTETVNIIGRFVCFVEVTTIIDSYCAFIHCNNNF